jgi:hypothetical protein
VAILQGLNKGDQVVAQVTDQIADGLRVVQDGKVAKDANKDASRAKAAKE